MSLTQEEKIVLDGIDKYTRQIIDDSDRHSEGMLIVLNRLVDSLSQRVEALTKTNIVFESPFQALLETIDKRQSSSVTGELYQANLFYITSFIEIKNEKISLFQKKEVANRVFDAGLTYLKHGLYSHSEACFTLSKAAYESINLNELSDQSSYYLSRSKHLSETSVQKQIQGQLLYLFSGYGYRPFRLLALGVITILLFSVLFWLLDSSVGYLENLFISANGYFSLVGFGDSKQMDVSQRSILIAEGFISLVINSSLLALLARKWFRL